jgi:AcrR family transcriptional regulator
MPRNTGTKGAVAKDPPVAPRERAPERRRQELIEAALEEFASKGLGGARVDTIVARTNSNKAMVYHYFGSKEGLYLAALEAVYEDIRKQEASIDFEQMPPMDALMRLTEFTFEYYLAHPAFVRMINNENLHKAHILKRSNSAAKVNSSIIVKLKRILQRGAVSGIFRTGLDPIDVYISISALGFMYVSNQHTLSIVFDHDLMTPRALRTRMQTIKDMVQRYVLKS